VDFFRRALDVAAKLDLPPAELAQVWESLGDVSELAGLYSDAAEAYSKSHKLQEQPRLLLKEGIIRERFGRYSDALRWYNRGLQAAETLEPKERLQLRFELSLAYAGVKLRQGEFRDCIDWCNRVVEEAAETQDLPALAHAYYLLHLSHTSLRSPERAAFRGLALPIYEELGDLLGEANVLNNLGIDAYYEGRWQEALDLYERSKEARERIGDVVGAAQITNNIGEIKSDQGYLTTASELFEEARGVFETAGHRMLATLATSNLGRAASRAGSFGDALASLQQALSDFHEIRAGSLVLETKARLAERAVLAAEPEVALREAEETLRETEETGSGATLRALLQRLRGYALAQSGDVQAARAALRESLATARAAEETNEAALTLEAIARLCRDPNCSEARESAALLARLGVVSTPDVPLP
jgi:tetratricopeptide (TPR) repeat protein